MSFELFLAVRYLREGRAQTAFILAGATVGLAVLVFVVALVDGLQRSFIRQTLSSQAHIMVKMPERRAQVLAAPGADTVLAHVEKAPDRVRSVDQWQQLLEAIGAIPGVVAVTPTVAGSAFASRGEATKSVAVRGVVGETFGDVLDVADKMVQGEFRPAGTDVVIGSVLAADLGVEVGDKLRLVAPDGRADLFTVRGIFDLGNRDVNQRWVLVSLHAGQTLLDLVGGVTTIEVRVADAFSAERIAQEIVARGAVSADSWMKSNAQLLVALRSQAMSGYIIQALVVVAVALGIASVLGVSVIQKSREIGILRATGTPRRRIQRVFLIQGGIVGLVGSIGGSVLGVLMALAFAHFARRPNGEPLFPVEVRPSLLAMAASLAIATGLVAAYLPARRAARLDPAVVIRHG